jgi:hypothetical protein
MNTDTLGLIVLYSGEFWTLQVLRNHICPALYASMYKISKKLIYGEVQSGKTAKIISEVQKTTIPIVLIIQNSLLVKKQYEDRFCKAGVPIQFMCKTTTAITERVVLLLNNQYQLSKYMTLNPPKVYTILLDESDLTQTNPLRKNALCEIHVTATPFRYKPNYFDEISFIDKHPDYCGLDKVQLRPLHDTKNYFAIVEEFIASRGILLINTFSRVEEMKTVAMNISSAHPTVPVILLTTNKGVYMNRNFEPIREKSLVALLDRFSNEPHLIILANRMATRGISFSNSLHTTHITHQVSNPNTITGFLQKCRILGIYPNHPHLTLYVNQSFIRRIEKYKLAIANRKAILAHHLKKGKVVYKSTLY